MSTRTSTGNQNRTSTGNQNRTVPKYGIRTKPALPSSPASEPAPQPSPPAQAWTASRAPALFILVKPQLQPRAELCMEHVAWAGTYQLVPARFG